MARKPETFFEMLKHPPENQATPVIPAKAGIQLLPD
jgi:hypothetical protein